MGFHHILFPVDFSDRAAAVARHVTEMVRQLGSELTLLHAPPELYPAYDAVTGLPDFSEPALLTDAKIQERLHDFSEKWLPGVTTHLVSTRGEPAAAITHFAHNRSVDLIMMPSHGYGPFRQLLLGSVTAKVLHDAQCPVWTSAHIANVPSEEHLPCRSILCAIDLTPRTIDLMKWSADLAKALNASLRFVHAVPRVETWANLQFAKDLVAGLRDDARHRIAEFQKEAGLDVPYSASLGAVSEVIREEAQQHGDDLIVIGRGNIQGVLGRLRTRAYSVISQAPCPLISV